MDAIVSVLNDIVAFNNNPDPLLSTLRSLTRKLLKDDVRYRTLDTRNHKVVDRLLSYEGVLDFLTLLGYESDTAGTKLICKIKPSTLRVGNVLTVLNQYHQKFHFNTSNNQTDDEGDDTMTLQQIILWGTNENTRDTGTMDTLILMHKSFTKSITLLRALKQRFFLHPPTTISDNVKLDEWRDGVQKRVQLKTIKTLRDWMKGHWVDDFAFDDEMQEELNVWIKEIEQTENAPTWYNPLARHLRSLVAIKQKEKKQTCYLDDIELINTNALVSGYFRSIGNCFAADNPYYDAPPNVLLYCVTYFEGSLVLMDPKQIAEQLTIIDFERMKNTKARAFLHYVCGIDDKTKNVLKMLDDYEALIEYVEGSIMNVNKSFVDEISNTIIRMIQICQHLVDLQNFHSAYAVYTGLDLLAVQSLSEAWEHVDEMYLNQFTQIKELFCSLRHNYNLRKRMRQSTRPMIPCMKLFLADLERINNVQAHQRITGFSKSVRLTDRIKVFQTYQKNDFALERNENIQILLLKSLV